MTTRSISLTYDNNLHTKLPTTDHSARKKLCEKKKDHLTTGARSADHQTTDHPDSHQTIIYGPTLTWTHTLSMTGERGGVTPASLAHGIVAQFPVRV